MLYVYYEKKIVKDKWCPHMYAARMETTKFVELLEHHDDTVMDEEMGLLPIPKLFAHESGMAASRCIAPGQSESKAAPESSGRRWRQKSSLEEPWTDGVEGLLTSIRMACETVSAKHVREGRRRRRHHHFYAIPSLVISAAMAPVTSALSDEDWMTGLEVGAFVLTGCLGALSTYMNHGAESERHFAFSTRYADLVTDIDAELARPREYREHVDTFLLRIKMTYDSLNRAAPDV